MNQYKCQFNSRFNVDLSPYKTIERIDKDLESHPAFKLAHPINQKDCPPDFKLQNI